MRGIGTSLSRRVALLLAATAFAVLGLTGVASAASFTVTDTTDAALANPTGTTCASTHGGTCTLRSAVQAADNLGGASTITVPAGDYQLSIPSTTTNDPSTGDLDVYDVPGAGAHSVQLTITGAGASSTILDANYVDRYFAVDAATTGQNSLSISGVTVEHGNQNDTAPNDHSTETEYGGAFYNDGSLSIDSSVLHDSSAYYSGGAVFSDYAATKTSITNSTMTGNTTEEDPSSEYGGGAVQVDSGSLTLTGDQITHNTSGYLGGAVLVYESGETEGQVTISNSTVSDNASYEDGGGIYLEDTGAITISNSDVSGNSSYYEGYGGGIYADSTGPLTVTNSTFDHNSGGDDGYEGGAIYTDGTDISVTGSAFTNNSGGQGGAIYIDGSSATAVETISQSTFTGNHSTYYYGGAIDADTGDLHISQSTLNDNSAPDDGGAVYYESGDGMSLTNDTIDGNQAGYDGGGIYFDEAASTGSISLLNDTIARNTAPYGGGIAYPYYANSIENTIVADNNGYNGGTGVGGGDCYYPATYTTYHADAGGNLDSDGSCFALASDKVAVNPLLGSLADNGGPTMTDALGAGSPAIGNATASDCPSVDQRGVARGSSCDIGAFQTAPAALTLSKAGPSSATVGNPFNYTITVSDGGPGPSTGTTVTDQLPAGETLWGATPSQGTCTSAGTPALITCDLGVVNNGKSATVALVVSEANAGAVTNTATAANDQGASATASATTTVTKPSPAASNATAPKATTGGASGVSKHGARLAGRVTTGNQSTVYLFQYGKRTSYGMSTAVFRLSSSASVSRAIGKLLAGTKYHYRLVASNNSGTAYGADRTFRTKPNKKKHRKHSRRHKR